MAINKVVFGAETLVDLTDSTVTPETLLEGIIAYAADGEKITGLAAALPEGITQIEYGTKTPTSASTGSSLTVAHSLGVVPTGGIVWLDTTTNYTNYMHWAAVIVHTYKNTYVGYGVAKGYNNGTIQSYTTQSNIATSLYVYFPCSSSDKYGTQQYNYIIWK